MKALTFWMHTACLRPGIFSMNPSRIFAQAIGSTEWKEPIWKEGHWQWSFVSKMNLQGS